MWLPPSTPPSPLSLTHLPLWLSLHQQGRYCSEGKTIALRDGFSYVVTQTTSYHLPTSIPPTPPSQIPSPQRGCIHPFIFFFLSFFCEKKRKKARNERCVLSSLPECRGGHGRLKRTKPVAQRRRGSARIEVIRPQRDMKCFCDRLRYATKGPTVMFSDQ